MKLIKTAEINTAGCYVIQLCINGIWEDIVIDDFLPIIPGSNKIAFGHARAQFKNDKKLIILWVSLIEKAWAKVHGNYDRIVMGSCDLGFACLCGVPSFTYKNNEYRGARKLELW